MSPVELGASPLRLASSKLIAAQNAVETASNKKRTHQRELTAKAARLTELETTRVAHRTAIALGDTPAVEEPDAAEIESLGRDISISESVASELDQRERSASAELAKAEHQHRKVAQQWLEAVAVEPARKQLVDALNAVRDAAVNLMAAHSLVHVEYERPDKWLTGDPGGPAETFLKGMVDSDNWAGWPYSLRPEWVTNRPWELAGFEDERARLRNLIEEEIAA